MATERDLNGLVLANDGDDKIVVLRNDQAGVAFVVGDCDIKNGARLTLKRDGSFHFVAQVSTRNPGIGGDQWHLGFTPTTRSGRPVPTFGGINANGPQMENKDQVLPFEFHHEHAFDPDFFESIQKVNIHGEC